MEEGFGLLNHLKVLIKHLKQISPFSVFLFSVSHRFCEVFFFEVLKLRASVGKMNGMVAVLEMATNHPLGGMANSAVGRRLAD